MEIRCNNKKELINCIEKISFQKCLFLFGAGTYGNILGSYLKKNNIEWEAYIDNGMDSTERILNGKPIIRLKDIPYKNNNVYIVSVMLYADVVKQLEQEGVRLENIYWFHDVKILDEVGTEVLETSEYIKKIEKFRNLHKGERCFLIGNGPSLVSEDLDLIANEYSMAANKIFQAFSKTIWRPTYYFCDDAVLCRELFGTKNAIKKVLRECEAGFSSTKHSLYRYRNEKDINNLYYYESRNTIDGKENIIPEFSLDCRKCVYTSYTIVYAMYQMALYMGFEKIYLLGMDFSFTREVNRNGEIIVHKDIKRNHSNLIDEIDIKKENSPRKYIVLEGHKVAKNIAEKQGVKIFNATRKTELDVFEKVSLRQIIKREG